MKLDPARAERNSGPVKGLPQPIGLHLPRGEGRHMQFGNCWWGVGDLQEMDCICQWVRTSITPRRWEHTLAVADCALKLSQAHEFSVSERRLHLAAVLHDCAKDLPLSAQLKQFARSDILLSDSDLRCPQVLHGPAGALLVRDKWGIADPEILGAIAWHTTAAPRMGKLELLVFMADMVSCDRRYPGVEALRELAFRDLSGAALAGIDKTVEHLLEQGAFIHPRVFLARNDLLARYSSRNREGRGAGDGRRP